MLLNILTEYIPKTLLYYVAICNYFKKNVTIKNISNYAIKYTYREKFVHVYVLYNIKQK